MRLETATDYAILGLLSDGARSGYELRVAVSEELGYFWAESFGQIYPTLRRLAREKLVVRNSERTGRRPRNVYTITAAGRERLAEWLRRQPQPRVPRNELLLKMYFARQLEPAEAAAHIQRYRQQQEVARAKHESLEQQFYEEHGKDPDLMYWLIALRYAQLEAEAHLRWAEEAAQILTELQEPAQAN
jgi:DNA-binding PadR family transcriptional regulator